MPKKQGAPSGKISDARFANFESDPRFRLPSKHATKTKIDKRFSRKLKEDEDFTSTAKVDKFGRKLQGDKKKKLLKNLYEESEDDEGEDDDKVEKELQKANAKIDPARGGGFSSSESESDSEGDDDEARSTELQGEGEPDEGPDVEVGEVTKRIAVLNLDWDYVRSPDLMVLFSGFVPEGGRIERISVIPSEFGKERMQREALEGPPKEIFKGDAVSEDEAGSGDASDADEEDEDEKIRRNLIAEGDDQEFNNDSLRKYQLDRLRYYFAVMELSDKKTAEAIYHETDGTEYQTSSNFIDLRFIPDDVEFDEEPRDTCEKLPKDYRPKEFVTNALQHSKVKLTWDMGEDEASRKEDIQRAFSGSRTQIEENDLRAYLASGSEEEDEEEVEEGDAQEEQPKLSKKELKRQKMRAALGLGPEPSAKPSKSDEAVGEMEITFAPDEEKESKKGGKVDETEETTAEKYMRKEREKKARRKEKMLAKRQEIDPSKPSEDQKEPAKAAEDLGFDDPFFTAAEPAKVSKNSQKKEERLKKKQQKEAEAAEVAAQKAQLQKITDDHNKSSGVAHLDHFDMNEIARVEKQKNKKGKKKGKKEAEGRGGLQEDFQMDVGDSRFQAVFDSHEFAIDPSDPKFKPTPGMKQVLEQSRKKRSQGMEDDERPAKQNKKARKH